MHSAGAQCDSSVTGVMLSLKDILSDSKFELDLDDMESTILFLNDEYENHLRSLPELGREAILMDCYDQLKAIVDHNKAMKAVNHPDMMVDHQSNMEEIAASSFAHSPARKMSAKVSINIKPLFLKVLDPSFHYENSEMMERHLISNALPLTHAQRTA